MFEKLIYQIILASAVIGIVAASEQLYPIPPIKIQVENSPVFEFCVVPLGIGADSFAAREFWLGGREQKFRAPPTRTRLSGSVVLKIGGKSDWCVLLGKTEVTISQWYGVMGTPVPPNVDGQLPITRISRAEIAVFLEKFNEKLKHQTAFQAISTSVTGSFENAFVRLPFENEWEFAARGGGAVDDNTFDKPTPYSGELNRYEWYFSQKSSKGKLKEVGLLAPNPLGLYDMLGNASEMVESYYQTEYSQGRLGGGIARGGNFQSAEKDITSSERMELQLVFKEGDAYKSGTVGFRLALGTLVIPTVAAGKKLEVAWQDHSSHRIQPSIVVPSASSVSETSGKDLEEINGLIKSLGQKLDLSQGDHLSSKQVLSAMEVRTASILGNLERANKNFADGTVKLASKISTNYFAYSANFILNNEVISNPSIRAGSEEMKNMEANSQTNKLKMNEEASSMGDILKMFGEIPRETIDSSFDEFLNSLDTEMSVANDPKLKSRIEFRIEATKAARETVLDYMMNRRLGIDGWEKGLSESAKKFVERLKK